MLVKQLRNHPPVITIFIGAMFTIPKWPIEVEWPQDANPQLASFRVADIVPEKRSQCIPRCYILDGGLHIIYIYTYNIYIYTNNIMYIHIYIIYIYIYIHNIYIYILCIYILCIYIYYIYYVYIYISPKRVWNVSNLTMRCFDNKHNIPQLWLLNPSFSLWVKIIPVFFTHSPVTSGPILYQDLH